MLVLFRTEKYLYIYPHLSSAHIPSHGVTQILPRFLATLRLTQAHCSMSDSKHSPTGRMLARHSSRKYPIAEGKHASTRQEEMITLLQKMQIALENNYLTDMALQPSLGTEIALQPSLGGHRIAKKKKTVSSLVRNATCRN